MTTRNNHRPWALAAVFAMAVAFAADALAADFFVSTDGNDAWSGKPAKPTKDKKDGPFATLQRARDAIRKLKKDGGLGEHDVRVLVAEGEYALAKPLELTAEDSGTEKARIVYRAVPGQRVVLSGGKRVTGFVPVKDAAVLKRLPEAARGKVVRADLKALGVTGYGSPKGGGLELFFNDQAMTLARWPNEGFVRIVEEAGGKKFAVRGRKGDKVGKWIYEGDRPKRWADEKDIWVHGYWFWDWSDQRHKVKRIDTEKRLMEVEPPYHHYGYRKGQWYYAYNLLAEIDEPGEWYLDRDAGVLYFWPPSPIETGKAVVTVLPSCITMKDVSRVTVQGLTIEAVRGAAIRISGGRDNRIVGCTIRNIGGGAISVSGGKGHGVIGCDMYGMARGGVSLRGGDRKTLTPAGHIAENNHIHHYGRVHRMYQKAVSLSGVGNRASHNLIHNAPHMAIGFSGNDHVIEYNEIHSVCYESNDAGAIYSGRDWTMRGTVIRHNFFHHISGFEGRGCVGVYLDDMFCGTTVYGNLFYRVSRAAMIGGGRDNVVENNLFIDCVPSLHIDNRAQGWASDHVNTTMKTRLEAMPYKQPPWSLRYVDLVKIWEDEPAAPKGNLVVRNVSIGGKWDGVHGGARKYQTIHDNLVDVDPRFATPDRFRNRGMPRPTDFALRPDSPAFSVGFTPLPLERMGLVADPTRAAWPPEHTVRWTARGE